MVSYIEIGYFTELSQPYITELRQCNNLQQLKAHSKKWKSLAYDSYKIVSGMKTNKQFEEFRNGMELEKRRKVVGAGPEWQKKYGAIVLPEIIMRVGLIAQHLHVPEGMAFIRCKKEGCIKINHEGVYSWEEPKREVGTNDSNSGQQ